MLSECGIVCVNSRSYNDYSTITLIDDVVLKQ